MLLSVSGYSWGRSEKVLLAPSLAKPLIACSPTTEVIGDIY
jgi:hypothetical protein